MRASSEQAPPLVVITTNEERELPAAFVRRCLVLTLELPKGDALVALLIERGRAHFAGRCSDKLYTEAARQLVKDRDEAETDVQPGQAEYLDLLRAVLDVAGAEAARQLEVLHAIRDFSLKKNPPPPT